MSLNADYLEGLMEGFVAYATGARGQATLASFGFKPATGTEA